MAIRPIENITKATRKSACWQTSAVAMLAYLVVAHLLSMFVIFAYVQHRYFCTMYSVYYLFSRHQRTVFLFAYVQHRYFCTMYSVYYLFSRHQRTVFLFDIPFSGRPYSSTGGLLFCSWCFLFRPTGTVVLDGLMFYPLCFLGSHISEVPRPIAAKLCHMIEILVEWPAKVQQLRGPPLKNIGGQKHAKFRSIFLQRPTWIPNISGTA